MIILIELMATKGDGVDELTKSMDSQSVASIKSATPPGPSKSMETTATGVEVDEKGLGKLIFLRYPFAIDSVVLPSQCHRGPKWAIHAVNVHQGDAILLDLQTGDGGKPARSLVIDTGQFCQIKGGFITIHAIILCSATQEVPSRWWNW